ncbi:BlaI/MecI/CopY family transcriptional regulator [Cyclobacterium sp. 1_MG-2023]|uniref:BlaI/MecI/CopY family transcriptional regulator n=1 Tax=Cyclobacterium sp. 1_MG-2023 TaxID=3062681 RepID=UPI0026E26A74|nr:BlaI/MecI/CopY family transcriptional regulator [Cyclobacterium sp. 1_MG-2023]MDO6436659.1 BlaI/MecI/CopY family transcriptional regulator [Cyclobacterium sp. 1_MG-2023]
MKLSKSEEKLMELIWSNQPIFMKELLEIIPAPKPAPSTVATLLKRMQQKGYVGFKLFGNSRQYYALVEKPEYFSGQVKTIIKDFFSNSPLQFASFFTKKADLTTDELEELKRLVETEIERRKN